MKCPYRNFEECLKLECAAYAPPIHLLENHIQRAWCRLTHNYYSEPVADAYTALIESLNKKESKNESSKNRLDSV